MADKVDILYLAWEREEFTRESFKAMYLNTDMGLVGKVYLYTDGCGVLGCCQGMRDLEIIDEKFGSPVSIMNDFLQRSHSEIFVKIDNDTMLPPGWLDEVLRLMAENPLVDVLGIEAIDPPRPGIIPHDIRYVDHVGGIGLFRRSIFDNNRPTPRGVRYGLTEWFWANPQINKAFINPPLNVFLLDHIEEEPWASLSRDYEKRGWQRFIPNWQGNANSCYNGEYKELYRWWINDKEPKNASSTR